jgi:cytoskeletal protein CcmA (bactofilin family)
MMRRRTAEQAAETTTTREVPRPETSARNSDVTVIGKGARLEGSLISAGSLRIEGTISGEVRAEGDVTLAPGADVKADIHAANVTIGSHYSGNVFATGTLEIEAGARLEGNVNCKSLVIHQGAMFSGQSNMDGGGGGGRRSRESSAASGEA